ncbi:hypothetical protein DL98DRAFT_658891 [Cadophora sp. DSE1049]|nr:hypothetical protein DL98DRAFT_658891 [Cadophora sp. DSE1049]
MHAMPVPADNSIYRSSSRRLALQVAHRTLAIAQAATLAASEAVFQGNVTIEEWRRAYWAEVAAAAAAAAIEHVQRRCKRHILDHNDIHRTHQPGSDVARHHRTLLAIWAMGFILASLFSNLTATLYIAGKLIANTIAANFGNTVQGVADVTAGIDVPLHMAYSMGDSLSTGGYGITLGVSVGNVTRNTEADSLASTTDISIILVSDRHSESLDNWSGLSLPGDQDVLISRLAEVDAVLKAWYGGQQIGLEIERLLFGVVNPSGKLPMTFPKTLNGSLQISGEVEVPYNEGLYVEYKWSDEHGVEPMFPLRHGLSYTSFEVSNISASLSSRGNWSTTDQSVVITTLLSNTGPVAGKEVLQLYVSYPAAANETGSS